MNGESYLIVMALVSVIEGGAAGRIAYWLWAKLEQYVPSFERIEAPAKRDIILVATPLIGVASYLLLCWFGEASRLKTLLPGAGWPQSPQEWVMSLLIVAIVTTTASQAVHGHKELTEEARVAKAERMLQDRGYHVELHREPMDL